MSCKVGFRSIRCSRVHTEPGKTGLPVKIGHFYEKLGKTWNSQGTFHTFYPCQGNWQGKQIVLSAHNFH